MDYPMGTWNMTPHKLLSRENHYISGYKMIHRYRKHAYRVPICQLIKVITMLVSLYLRIGPNTSTHYVGLSENRVYSQL